MIRGVAVASVIALVVIAVPSHAQTTDPCVAKLVDAQTKFDIGQFEEVLEVLKDCDRARVERSTKVDIRFLRAQACFLLDRLECARTEISDLIRLEPDFAKGTPEFRALVADVRGEDQSPQVASVSKTRESLRDAPATIVVITSEDIARRGYLDLEQLFHDVPGFDVARLNGDIYSYIYQRGYRSQNDRLLLLIDGVEQNELASDILYLSRQFSLTNIDRVEIIYGPASTMYGANAFTGVISIITKESQSITGSKTFGVLGQVTAGGYGSRSVDVTVSNRTLSNSRDWSVSAQVQTSRERDLSQLDDWDYTYRNRDYSFLNLFDSEARRFISAGHCSRPSPYYQCTSGTSARVVLTPAGEEYLRGLDRKMIEEQGLGFREDAQNWSIFGKMRLSNLTLGVQAWRSQESTVSQYGSESLAGNDERTPRFTAFYAQYAYRTSRGDTVKVLLRHQETGFVKDRSHRGNLHTYFSGFLTLWSLVPPCISPSDKQPVGCAPAQAWNENVIEETHSNKLSAEVNATYSLSSSISGVAGIELARSSIQDQLNQVTSGPGELYYTKLREPEQVEHTDAALYVQGSYKHENLRVVAAGRFSHNQINFKPGASGYGFLVTPRAAVMYTFPTTLISLKAVYSEAFKDPSDTQKFGIIRDANEVPSGGLQLERVRNVEVSAGWAPIDEISVDASVFRAHYTDIVSGGSAPGCLSEDLCLQWQNRDDLRITGFQANAQLRVESFDFWVNYTHTRPFLHDPINLDRSPLLDDEGNRVERLRVADIAANRWNVGVNLEWPRRLWTGLRLHYVGERRTGEGTTDAHPYGYVNPYPLTDARFTVDATVSYEGLLPNTTLQLMSFNLLNTQYYEPNLGIVVGVPRVPQSGRTVHLRLKYRLPRR